ncbi:MAG TPA: DUF4783 domain-containing protein [Ohtaekwangia sp.]|nr:DUF4783 domain-containing protein [Ohtaekwangia sp.]
MKLKIFLAVFALLAVHAASVAQSDVIGQVKETIKAGSAKELSRFLNNTVDVTLEGNVQSYSKAQAEFVLRDFFKQHPPNEVNIIHQGKSKGGQPFAILQYKSGVDTYRLFMKVKSQGNSQYLDDIRFTRE